MARMAAVVVRVLAGLTACLGLSAPGTAGLITFELRGTMLDAAPNGEWAQNTPFLATYTFNPRASSTYNPNIQMTVYRGAVSSTTLDIGTRRFESTAENAGDINVADNQYSAFDRYILDLPLRYDSLPPSWHVEHLQFDFLAATTSFSGNSILSNPAILQGMADAMWPGSTGRLFIYTAQYEVLPRSLRVTSVERLVEAPEISCAGFGSACALVAAALGFVERRARRGRRGWGKAASA